MKSTKVNGKVENKDQDSSMHAGGVLVTKLPSAVLIDQRPNDQIAVEVPEHDYILT